MDGGSVAVAITGIVVSGVLGPVITNKMTRRGDKQEFTRDTGRQRRDELRDLLDAAAALLSGGPRILRQQAQAPDDLARSAAAHEWADQVFPMRERLALRLPAEDPILAAYDGVLTATKTLVKQSTDRAAVTGYETARDTFLAKARSHLAATIPDTTP